MRSIPAAVALAAVSAAVLVVWLGSGLLARQGGPAGRSTPARLVAPVPSRPPAPARRQLPAPRQPVASGMLAAAGRDVLVTYRECPAKCLVDVLEHYHPEAAIGAQCTRLGAELFLCLSIVDDPGAQLYDCRTWLVRTDRRLGIEVLKTGPADCPPRPTRPPAGAVAG